MGGDTLDPPTPHRAERLVAGAAIGRVGAGRCLGLHRQSPPPGQSHGLANPPRNRPSRWLVSCPFGSFSVISCPRGPMAQAYGCAAMWSAIPICLPRVPILTQIDYLEGDRRMRHDRPSCDGRYAGLERHRSSGSGRPGPGAFAWSAVCRLAQNIEFAAGRNPPEGPCRVAARTA